MIRIMLALAALFTMSCASQVYIHDLRPAESCLDVTNEIYDVGNMLTSAKVCDETMPERLNVRLAEIIRMGVEYSCPITLKDREMQWAIAQFQQWELRCLLPKDTVAGEEVEPR